MGAQRVRKLYSCFHSDGSCPCRKLESLETLVSFGLGLPLNHGLFVSNGLSFFHIFIWAVDFFFFKGFGP